MIKRNIPTIKQIAGLLKVSISTVSKALNNHHSIGLTTKEKIHKLAAELNYSPNQAAIHFKQKKTFTIGIIIPDLADQLFSRTLTGIEDFFMKRSYNVFISQSHESFFLEKELVKIMQKNRVDGLIITITKNTTTFEHLKRLEELNIPIVYLIRNPDNIDCYSVNSNVFKGSFDAVNYLVKRGHQRIAHLKGPDNLITSNERHAGYLTGLKFNHISIDENLIKTTLLDKESTQKAMQELLDLEHKPTAIVAFKNAMVLDAMQFVKKNQYHLSPIEFVGFGNSDIYEYLDNSPLASLEQYPYEIGAKTSEMLFNLITDQAVLTKNIILDCELVTNIKS